MKAPVAARPSSGRHRSAVGRRELADLGVIRLAVSGLEDRRQPVGDLLLGAGQEVAVAVVHRCGRGVSSAPGNLVRACSRRDPQVDGGVAHVVDT